MLKQFQVNLGCHSKTNVTEHWTRQNFQWLKLWDGGKKLESVLKLFCKVEEEFLSFFECFKVAECNLKLLKKLSKMCKKAFQQTL